MEQETRCPVYKKCGGCQLDVGYAQQLSYKQRLVREKMGRYGRIEPIIGMDEPWHYRCKISTAFDYINNRIVTGVWQASSGHLVRIDGCRLEDSRAVHIIRTIRELLPYYKLRSYDERTHKGFIRFVMIRIGKQTGEILLAIGTGAGHFPTKKQFIDELVRRCPGITTIVQNLSTDRFNLILGEKETILYGPGYIHDRLSGFSFRISARSFFQINPVQTEKLYQSAVEMADLSGKETVVDAYCGVGSIGIIASPYAAEVISAEQNREAVRNAVENVRENGITNVRVYEADAGKFMNGMAAEGKKADVVFLDPPRAGCSPAFLNALGSLVPAKIVYISCNIDTQARDLNYLTRHGYRVKKIQPVDMFPQTRHVENIVLLTR